MNTNNDNSKGFEIDFVDFLWRLLTQWKAILIVCILMAILVSGAKYLNDTRAYKNTLAEQKAAEESLNKPVEDRIEEILEALPEADRNAVLYILKQQEMATLQQEYLNNSIWLNIDPYSQRVITVRYIIKRTSDLDLQTLVDAYNSRLRRESFLTALRDVIAPESKIEYIYELINSGGGIISDSDTDSCMYSLSITVPDNVDAETISKVIDNEIIKVKEELDDLIGTHTMHTASIEDSHTYSQPAVDRRTNTLYAINNLNNNIKNARSSLSADQLASLEAITALNNGPTEVSVLPEPPTAPGFSKKYMLLGFILGGFLYAGIYLLLYISRKSTVGSVTLQNCIGTRMIGEIYTPSKQTGFLNIFNSPMINKWRYRGKLDIDKQINAITDTICAICVHQKIDTLPLLKTGVGEEFMDALNLVTKKCSLNCIDVTTNDTDKMEEKAFTSIGHSVIVVSNHTKLENLKRLMSLFNDYNITNLGFIYLEQI